MFCLGGFLAIIPVVCAALAFALVIATRLAYRRFVAPSLPKILETGKIVIGCAIAVGIIGYGLASLLGFGPEKFTQCVGRTVEELRKDLGNRPNLWDIAIGECKVEHNRF